MTDFAELVSRNNSLLRWQWERALRAGKGIRYTLYQYNAVERVSYTTLRIPKRRER